MKKIASIIGTFLLVIGYLIVINNDDLSDIFSNKSHEPKVEDVQTSEEDKELINISYSDDAHPENYVVLNNNQTSLNEDDKTLLNNYGTDRAWQDYQELDSLGRGQTSTGLVTNKIVTQRSQAHLKKHGMLYGDEKIYKRPPFPSYVHVAGEYKDGWFDTSKQRWKGETSNNGQTDLGTYKGWLYNKSHTLGFALGGDMETHNVTLGTRSQNVGSGQNGGMGYPESEVKEAVENNKDAKVYYQATPVYNKDELVPRGTHVRAYSVNDNGKTVNLNVWVFNTQNGVDIDYKTGAWTRT